ncbi:MAG: VapC toxin family PIN domain ribonuclease, partial [Proteobacteria bacterium]|nr:VapC toxin family PIN domain ribonuclease [Pseudomonadota bacterium]
GADYLDLLIQQERTFGINEYIYQELLQGARDEKEFVTLREYLSELPIYSLRFGLQSFENAARLNFRCRRKGITIRSTVDLLIAETAIENDLILLHDDQDYVNLGKAIPELHLYQSISRTNY